MTKKNDKEDLSLTIKNSLRKYSEKNQNKALLELRENPKWFDPDIPSLNYAIKIKNNTGLGLPLGCVVELLGEEKSGKTTFTLYLAEKVMQANNNNGIVFLVQNEGDVTRDRAYECNLDWDKRKKDGNLLLNEFNLIEETLVFIEGILDQVVALRRQGNKDTVAIILDSIAASSNLHIWNKKYKSGDFGHPNNMVKLFAQNSRLKLKEAQVLFIVVNQEALDPNPFKKSHQKIRGRGGGKPLAFFNSCQLYLTKIRDWNTGKGFTSKIWTRNSKVGTPNKYTILDFLYIGGLIPHSGIYHVLQDSSIFNEKPTKSFWNQHGGSKLVSSKGTEYYHEFPVSKFNMNKAWEKKEIREFLKDDLKEYYNNKIWLKEKEPEGDVEDEL